jgi:hypothetical protein
MYKRSRQELVTSSQKVVTDAISQREAARRFGVRLFAVQKRIKAGTLTTLPDGKLDWQTVQREWVDNRDASKVRKRQPAAFEDDNTSYLAAKTKRAYLRLELEKLNLAVARGEIAPIGEIHAHVAGMIIRCRDMLLQVPSLLKDRLSGETDPARCEELLNAEFERALAELKPFRPAVKNIS